MEAELEAGVRTWQKQKGAQHQDTFDRGCACVRFTDIVSLFERLVSPASSLNSIRAVITVIQSFSTHSTEFIDNIKLFQPRRNQRFR